MATLTLSDADARQRRAEAAHRLAKFAMRRAAEATLLGRDDAVRLATYALRLLKRADSLRALAEREAAGETVSVGESQE